MDKFLLVGVGGFIGAVARYSLAQVVNAFIFYPFPIATLTVNFLGCLAVGILVGYLKEHHLFPVVSLFMTVGFLGSFTTFSAFGLETIELIRSNQVGMAFANIGMSIVFSLGAVAIGLWLVMD